MNQSAAMDESTSALSLITPWLAQHLPDLEPAACRRFIQLVSGIFETRSLLIETIADSSAFCATATSNATQVRRILRDLRLMLEAVYFRSFGPSWRPCRRPTCISRSMRRATAPITMSCRWAGPRMA